MQQTNNKLTSNNSSANSICIPRAFVNISEARVRKVFDALNIFQIDRVDMKQRKNEKGEPFQRIFVHIKTWSETADAQKARERLLAGKELKIVYDDPWFWKVALNTWTQKPVPVTSLYDRKPKIRLEFEDETTKNVEAATALLGSLNISEDIDQRPYRERRVDPNYCKQDQAQGFKERKPKEEQDTRPYRERRVDPNYCKQDQAQGFKERKPKEEQDQRPKEKPLPIAPGLPEPVATAPIRTASPVATAPIRTASPVKRDPFLVAKMTHMFNTEITDEIYLANRQRVRELLKEAQDNEEDESDPIDYRGENGTIPAAPKRNPRKVVE